ncbi:putative bifunctional diguanylate cyclase/phosphodiesterase [Sphingomonas profundi]|uniref:putative bifunctional diguanylate cyclase/phosphodiesterase n=1 Tax=Alterirhizorhabdus profundi TaxID=2681549 RepID=UPI0012E93E88|nr:EAL domain-containing protein [Sphingomonas profundi]
MTMRHDIPQKLELAAASSSRILESLHHPVLVINAHSEITYANSTAAVSLGGWIVGLKLNDIFSDYLRPALIDAGPSSMKLTTLLAETFDALFNPIGDGDACISLWPVAAAVDQMQPQNDDLTGLALRNTFMAGLEYALSDIEGAGSIAVLCLDLDRFKIINDTLGHGIGDQLLKKVADRLSKVSRKDDLVARLGGDEFVILQRGVRSPRDAELLAERLVDLVGRTYVLSGHTVNIGVSVGVALASGPVQPRDLLRNADLALYEAKRAGRGRYRFFEQGMDTLLHERRELEIDLRRALALKQFELHYQPFLDLATDTVMGFEALLRWNHPMRGNVPPLDFIAVAEENGLIVKIGEWVLLTACAAAASWPEKLVVAVNVSPIQFKADSLLASVSLALERSGLAPERLEIEITESALLADTDNVLATLHALRALGVKISMDDFGTGYSSLSYLQKFPFNKIKIDRSFVVGGDADSAAILKAVSGLGTSLGMAITAEGVETTEQLERIRDQNCTHVQGYLTGRPMTRASVQSFLSPKFEGDSNVR